METKIATEVWAVRITEACVVCGGCTLVCPTDALMLEDDGAEVQLLLDPQECISCEACVTTCAHYSIEMDSVDASPSVVATSEWVYCRGCGEALANRAEIDSMCDQLRHAGFSENLIELNANFCIRCKYSRTRIPKGRE